MLRRDQLHPMSAIGGDLESAALCRCCVSCPGDERGGVADIGSVRRGRRLSAKGLK